MLNDILVKNITKYLINAVLKHFGLVIMTIGGYSLSFTAWFGNIIITGFGSANEVLFQNLDLIRTTDPMLLKEWSRQVFLELLRVIVTSPLFFLLVFLPGAIIVVAHSLAKKEILRADINRWHGLLRRFLWFYQRGYYLITFSLFILLLLLIFVSENQFLVYLSSLLLIIATVVSTYMYARDLAAGGLWDRCIYIFGVLALVITIILFPMHYGRNFFDYPIEIPDKINGKKALDPLVSISFLFSGRKLGGRYYYEGDQKVIEWIEVTKVERGRLESSMYDRARPTLRAVIKEFSREKPKDEPIDNLRSEGG